MINFEDVFIDEISENHLSEKIGIITDSHLSTKKKRLPRKLKKKLKKIKNILSKRKLKEILHAHNI